MVDDQIEMHKLRLIFLKQIDTVASIDFSLTFIDTIASIDVVVFENELKPCLCESV